MLNELLLRLERTPGLTALAVLGTIVLAITELLSAGYLLSLFRRIGEPGFVAFAVALTVGFVLLMSLRWMVGRARHGLLRVVLAGGAEGDIALLERTARLPTEIASGAHGAAEQVLDAFSASNLAAVLDMPGAIVFAGAVFVVSGPAAGLGGAVMLLLIALVLLRAGQRARVAGLEMQKARVALVKTTDPTDRARLAHDIYGKRAQIDASGSHDKAIGAISSGMLLVGTVGLGAILSDAGTAGTLVVANILAGRALACLMAGIAALLRMGAAMSSLRALHAELDK